MVGLTLFHQERRHCINVGKAEDIANQARHGHLDVDRPDPSLARLTRVEQSRLDRCGPTLVERARTVMPEIGGNGLVRVNRAKL